MIKRRKKSTDKLKKERDENYKHVAAEAHHWVAKNKGLRLPEGKQKAYLSPRISSEYMDCSMPMTFDHYSYCSLGCLYCFAYFFKSVNTSFNASLHPAPIDKIIAGLEGNLKKADARNRKFNEHFYSKKFLLHWGGMADPFCNFEKENNTGFPLLQALGGLNYPTLFSFKGKTVLQDKYLKLFDKYSKQKNFAFQVSIITGDEELAKKVEIGVPSPKLRIKAIKRLSDMGYYTILRLRPFIIGVSDEGLDDLLHRALEAGIQGVSMEFFAVDVRSSEGMKTRYDWLASVIGVKKLVKYFQQMSPSERGGYLRLNRLVKEPYVKKVFQFCVKHGLVFGCSDPDFKELNTSGSCCAMPDNYPDNPLLENWTKGQLTYHLKEARIKYHKKGKFADLTFSKVFPLSSGDTYMDDPYLTNDHVKVVSDCSNVERQRYTFRSLAQKVWNNLRSPSNPQNYFHGKIRATGVDEEKNLVFKYEPSEYEEDWVNEGIDLTK